MTAIVGLVDNGTVYMGGDSAGVAHYSMTVRKDEKVFINGSYLFGFTTSFRMGQLLQYSFEPPAPTDDLDKFMRTTFVDAIRDCLKTGGYASKNNEAESGGEFLVGVSGRLFSVSSDYQVGEASIGFDAVGIGESPALGALFALRQSEMSPKQRVRVALEAAERFNAGVRAPFRLKQI